jgi:hypothetical protein
MKKYLLLFAAMLLIIALAACNKEKPSPDEGGPASSPAAEAPSAAPEITEAPTEEPIETPAPTEEPEALYPLFHCGFVCVRVGDKFTYADMQGELLTEPRFDNALEFSNGYAPVYFDGHWGYIDESGEVAIAPRFLAADCFTEELRAAVCTDDRKWGVIDASGEYLVEPIYDYPPLFLDNGLTAVCSYPYYGLLGRDLNVLVEPKFDYISDQQFSEGLLVVRENSRWGVIDESGAYVIEPVFDELGDKFSHGKLAAKQGAYWGYIDRTGAFVIEPAFEFAECFEDNGLAEVGFDSRIGFIDEAGEYVIEPEYELVTGASCRLIGVCRDYDKWAIVDPNCGPITEFAFVDVMLISPQKALYAVTLEDGACGVIGSEGYLFEPQFAYVSTGFTNGVSRVCALDWETFGYITDTGKVLAEPRFESANDFTKAGLAAVKVDGKWGYLGLNGMTVIKPRFELAYDFADDGYALAMMNGKWGVINTKGDFVIEPAFDEIHR